MPCRGLATGNWKVVMMPAVVMRPIWSPLARVNHRAPSGPAVMPMAPPPPPNSVMPPSVVMRPIFPLTVSVNHTAPSGPAVMPRGKFTTVLRPNSISDALMAASLPANGSMRRIASNLSVVKYSLLSAPFAKLRPVTSGNSVTTPAGVIRPPVNHKLPSAPRPIPVKTSGTAAVNSVTTAGTQRYSNCSRVKATRRGRLPFRREEGDHQRPNRLFIVDLFKGHQGCALVMWPLETQVLLRPTKAATSIYGSPPWRGPELPLESLMALACQPLAGRLLPKLPSGPWWWRPSRATESKKPAWSNTAEVIDHAGLLCNEPPAQPGCPLSSHPTKMPR